MDRVKDAVEGAKEQQQLQRTVAAINSRAIARTMRIRRIIGAVDTVL